MLANVDALYQLGGSATRPAPLWKEAREHGADSKPQDLGPGGNDTDGADDGGRSGCFGCGCQGPQGQPDPEQRLGRPGPQGPQEQPVPLLILLVNPPNG